MRVRTPTAEEIRDERQRLLNELGEVATYRDAAVQDAAELPDRVAELELLTERVTELERRLNALGQI